MNATMALVAVVSSLGGAAGVLAVTVILESRLDVPAPLEATPVQTDAPAHRSSATF